MKLLVKLLYTVAVLLVYPAAVFAGDAFILGVAPHTSARVILEMYQPLRQHLEKTLNLSVEVVTAPDFDDFARRALKNEYDLAVTTGHQARLIQTDAGYLPLLTYKADFKAVTLVAAKDPIRSPGELKGKSVLGLSPTSLVTLWGEQWLASNGLGEIRVRYISASDSVAQLIVSNEAAAGFTSLANFLKLPPDLRAQLRIFAESPTMAGRVYLLKGSHKARLTEVEAALWSFAETPEGKRYFEANKLEGYRKLKPKELSAMDIYADAVRKILKKAEK